MVESEYTFLISSKKPNTLSNDIVWYIWNNPAQIAHGKYLLKKVFV